MAFQQRMSTVSFIKSSEISKKAPSPVISEPVQGWFRVKEGKIDIVKCCEVKRKLTEFGDF